jgi:alanine dehydrogenase
MKAPLFLDHLAIERLLTAEALLPALRASLIALVKGEASHSARHVLGIEGGALGMMAGASPSALGAKLVCVLPGNAARGLNPHQGIVALFDSQSGACLAIGDASAITALRTAALSAAATDALANRKEASVLTITGAGLQAEMHARMMHHVRPLKELRIVARNLEAARALKKRLHAHLPSVTIFLHYELERALPGSDILCLCTSARYPYLQASQLPIGVHVNAVGACRPGSSEIDLDQSDAISSFPSLFVESLFAAKEEAEELKGAFKNPALPITELGAVFSFNHPGRKSEQEITFFKSVGIGLADAEALRLAYDLHLKEAAKKGNRNERAIHLAAL